MYDTVLTAAIRKQAVYVMPGASSYLLRVAWE